MSDCKAKMHQKRVRLGLRPKPNCGSLQRSPRPPSWNKWGLLLREGTEKAGEEGEDRGRKRGKRREG